MKIYKLTNAWCLLLMFMLATFQSCIDEDSLRDCSVSTKDVIPVKATLYCDGDSIKWSNDATLSIIDSNVALGKYDYRYNNISNYINNFTPILGSTPLTYSSYGKKYTAVSPAGIVVDQQGEALVSIADQTNQAALDFCSSDISDVLTMATDTLRFKMHRQMSLMTINLSAIQLNLNGSHTDISDMLKNAIVQIDGMNTVGKFNLNDKTWNLSDVATITALNQNDGKTAVATVFPRKAGEGVIVRVIIPELNIVKTFAMDPELDIERCQNPRFDITVEYNQPVFNVDYELVGFDEPSDVKVTEGSPAQKWDGRAIEVG